MKERKVHQLSKAVIPPLLLLVATILRVAGRNVQELPLTKNRMPVFLVLNLCTVFVPRTISFPANPQSLKGLSSEN
jgi:hypothetical protein